MINYYLEKKIPKKEKILEKRKNHKTMQMRTMTWRYLLN